MHHYHEHNPTLIQTQGLYLSHGYYLFELFVFSKDHDICKLPLQPGLPIGD
jgi:hypothetical protein